MNPLLACMMLLTFSHCKDIPQKMHLFYAQAFEALYQRHDRNKPGSYKRTFYTNLPEDRFRTMFAYFCLISYYKQEFRFERDMALHHIESAGRVTNIDIASADFLRDLCESVCMLVVEGLTYTFSHRSFQEYFAAYCLAHIWSKDIFDFAEKFARRSADSVIELLFEMNPDRMRDEYIVPQYNRFKIHLHPRATKKNIIDYMEALDLVLVVEKDADKPVRAYIGPTDAEFSTFANMITRLLSRSGEFKPKYVSDEEISTLWHAFGNKSEERAEIRFQDGKIQRRVSEGTNDWLEATDQQLEAFSPLFEFFGDRMKAVHAFCFSAAGAEVRANKEIGSIFGEDSLQLPPQ